MSLCLLRFLCLSGAVLSVSLSSHGGDVSVCMVAAINKSHDS